MFGFRFELTGYGMIQWLKIETRYPSIKDLIPCASCGVQSILARSLRDISGGPLSVCMPGMQITLSSSQRVAFSGKHGYRVRLVYFGWYYMYSAMKMCLMTAYRVLAITPTTRYLSVGNRFFQACRSVSYLIILRCWSCIMMDISGRLHCVDLFWAKMNESEMDQ